MTNKKISICIPFYNIEPYVRRCLDSVLNNTYTNLEVICVNDGSTDNTLAILREYEKKDSRVIVIDKENGGLPSARNAALDCYTGDFVAIIDGDDWIHRQYFEILLKVQQETNADVVLCDLKVKTDSDEQDEEILEYKIKISCLGLDDLLDNWTAKVRIVGRLYSKKIIGENRLPLDISMGEDILYNLSVLCSKKEVKIASIDTKLYYYFMREDSISHTEMHGTIVKVSNYILENIDKYHSKKGKRVLILQALRSMYAYRYLEMFSGDKKLIKDNCKRLYKLCCKNWNSIGLSIMEKMKYRLLYYIPFIYRLMRIIKDPTMLEWEKQQRLSYK